MLEFNSTAEKKKSKPDLLIKVCTSFCTVKQNKKVSFSFFPSLIPQEKQNQTDLLTQI